ncbi:Bifunctional inhibitor/lipid-transfer protein/seed storage 2S albumin superfamily protein [Zea mays]|uniref:Bifunctional inhibitor/lipid-transfer protein/seed storage 2S albumin superfamily protein n=1 Tax=Zea mays TaxID=4577 RepID=A0A1D6HTC0_MAIZE|nr:Bifunctional inhibitor/lipid-transfer protein/seed storage 2S albumin superfamily protein [Zea mays]
MGSASASVMTTSLLALALAALAFVSRAAAQGNGCSSVMMTLAPCMDFISSKASEPGISCCSVLAGVVQTDPRCLCMVLDGTATSFGIAINQTRALELPGVCKASLRHLHRRLPTNQQRQRRKKPTQLQMPLQQMEPQAPQTQRMQRAYCFSSAHCCMPSNKW